jgi:ubiquinone/menaquinone biosynthesis C-methylase UbiE
MSTHPNKEQQEYWNQAGGERWVTHQDALDQMVRPFGKAALERLAIRAGEHVLDVGCGCGDTLIELGRAAGAQGSVTGIDLSEPMLARARERVAGATLIAGDASDHPFGRKFDAIYSRFGVMFFSDPVAAFSHLAAALAPTGRMAFVCWRAPEDNPWASLPFAAVRSVLSDVALPWQDEGPGPFAFGKRERIAEVLGAAGFASIDIAAFDADVVLSSTGLADAVRFALTVGPASRLVAEAAPEQKQRVEEALGRVLAPHLNGGRLTLSGAAWTVLAKLR